MLPNNPLKSLKNVSTLYRFLDGTNVAWSSHPMINFHFTVGNSLELRVEMFLIEVGQGYRAYLVRIGCGFI